MDKCIEAFEQIPEIAERIKRSKMEYNPEYDFFHAPEWDSQSCSDQDFVNNFRKGWQSRQAEVDALNDNHLAYIDKVIAMESDYLEKIVEKEKRIEELTHLATELAQYASYAEIVGAISHNRQPIREFCDKIFDFNKKVEEEALRGEHE